MTDPFGGQLAGRVEAIHVAPAAGEPMRPLARVRAIAGIGLEGDRYARRTGHWSPIKRGGDRLTLVEAPASCARRSGSGGCGW